MLKQTKYRVIWIDDQRDPVSLFTYWNKVVPKEFLSLVDGHDVEIVWCKSYDAWVDWSDKWIKEDPNEYVNCFCLDHDLGSYKSDDEKTGYNVAVEICDIIEDYGFKFPYYECHSSNPSGRDNILYIFETYKKYLIK